VEKIEIITNPSSKYDAQGVAGLLNIILKKNARDGVNGRASASYEQTSYPKYGGDVDLNYRSGKLNVFGSTSIKKGQYLTEENLDNIYSRNITPYYYFEKDNRLRNHTSSFNKLGIDYAINESNDIGLQIEHSYFLKKGADRNDAVFINSGSMLDSIYKTGIAVRNYYNNLSGNLHYAVKLDTAGQSLSFDLDYTRYSQPENLTTTTTERYGKGTGKLGDDIIFKNQSEQKINIYAAKGDYSKRIFKDVLLEGGSKYYSLSTDNDLIFQDKRSDEWLKNTEKSNKFEYKESNLAVYTNLSKDFGDKWSLQGGLRYEHTTWSGSSSNPGINIGKEYNRLFPSVFVQYNATPDNQISLNYTQRISRPDYTDLNPFRYYTNPNSYIEGNPFLQPAITNSVDLSYTFKTKYYFDLFLYKTQGQITQVPLLNATDHSYKYQSINLDNSYNWGFNSYIPVSIRPWWQSSYSLIVGFNGVRSNISGLAYRYSNFNIQFSTNQQFVLSKQQSFFGELNFFYQPAGATQGMFILGKMADLSVGVKKLFFKEKLTVAANLLDVLNAAYITAKVDREDQYSFINGNYDKRGIRLTITYKFGNTSMKSASERKSGIQEEKSRIK
ncbi:MAG: TonB-dependent receptor, partial [uncultured bacterium]